MKKTNLFKSMLLLCALVVGSHVSRAADPITIASLVNNTTTGWTLSTAGSTGSGTSLYWKLTSSSHYITSPTIVWSNYTNITITIKARTYGGVEAANNKISVSQGETELTSYTPGNTTLTYSSDLSITPSSGALTIACLGANGSKGAGISEIIIKGEVASTDPTKDVSVASLAFGEVEATGSKSLTFTVTPSNLTAGLTLSTNNALYTVSPTSISKDATGAQTITVTAKPTTVNDNMDGTITISGDDFVGDDSEVTLSTTVIRKSAALAFDPTSVTLTAGGAFSAPTFTKDAGIAYSAITFTSSYEDVATVDDKGVISLVSSTGTAVIKATSAQTDVYAAGAATCTITVNPSGVTPEPSTTGYYEKVTSTAGVTAGKYLIVYETDNIAFDGSLAELDAGGNTYDITISDNKVAATDANNDISFTLAAYDGGFSIKSASGKYIGRAADSNGMDRSDSELKNTISISSGNAAIASEGGRHLRFNSSTGSSNYRFRYYASDKQQNIQLYKYVAPVAPTNIDIYVSEAGYATYASNFDLDFTSVANLKAYIAKKEESTVKLYEITKVPKNTGILLCATDGGGKKYTVDVATGDMDTTTGNLFVRGTGAAVATSGGGDFKNYILNVVNNKLGFYQANGNTVATNRAYLHTDVAAPAGAIELMFDDEETTGIANVSVKNTTSSEYFNLAGQRVAQPTKGLYIVNGKKVVIK